jgi:polyisoprenoid-binding protein YceI
MQAASQFAADGTWLVDPEHSSIEFRVRHLMVESVRGRFLEFTGAVETGEEPRIAGTIRAASLETHHRERDEHLRSPDFLDVDRHPEIAFASTNVELGDDGTLVLVGNLTIKGITRPIELTGADVEMTLDVAAVRQLAVERAA